MLPNVRGLRGPLSCLDEARFGIAWGATGAARACYESALEYAKTRVQFERPIGSFQLVQQKLAIMATELVKAQLLALQLGRLKDEGLLHPVQISLAKRNNVREALKTAREARSVLGANGITLEYPGQPPHEQPGIGLHLRRHRRYPHADHRTGDYGTERVLLSHHLRESENLASPSCLSAYL